MHEKLQTVIELLNGLANREDQIGSPHKEPFCKIVHNCIDQPKDSPTKLVLLTAIQDIPVRNALSRATITNDDEAKQVWSLLLSKAVTLYLPPFHGARNHVTFFGRHTPLRRGQFGVDITITEEVEGTASWTGTRTYTGTLYIPEALLESEDEDEIQNFIDSQYRALNFQDQNVEYYDSETEDVTNICGLDSATESALESWQEYNGN